jgi:hypothetical protein
MVVDGKYNVRFTYVLTIYLNNRFTPTILLPHLPFSLLRTISTGFIVLFSHMNAKHIHHILSPKLPLAPTPGQDPF